MTVDIGIMEFRGELNELRSKLGEMQGELRIIKLLLTIGLTVGIPSIIAIVVKVFELVTIVAQAN